MKERDELHQNRLAELRGDIAIGVEQADRGQVRPYNDNVTERVKKRGRKRMAAMSKQARNERTKAYRASGGRPGGAVDFIGRRDASRLIDHES